MSRRMLVEFECPEATKEIEALSPREFRFEALVPHDAQTAPCPYCGTAALRVISAPRTLALDWVSGDFPTRTAFWGRALTEKHRAADARYNEDNGQ